MNSMDGIIIDKSTYQMGYEDGYRACSEKHKDKIEASNQQRKAEIRYLRYFIKQRAIGILLLLFTVVSIKLLEGDATIAIVLLPMACMLIFSKEKIWMDDYFFEAEKVKLKGQKL